MVITCWLVTCMMFVITCTKVVPAIAVDIRDICINIVVVSYLYVSHAHSQQCLWLVTLGIAVYDIHNMNQPLTVQPVYNGYQIHTYQTCR